MELHELSQFRVTAIYFRTLSEYFSTPEIVKDLGKEFCIATYWIEKSQITSATLQDKELRLLLNSGETVKLEIQR